MGVFKRMLNAAGSHLRRSRELRGLPADLSSVLKAEKINAPKILKGVRIPESMIQCYLRDLEESLLVLKDLRELQQSLKLEDNVLSELRDNLIATEQKLLVRAESGEADTASVYADEIENIFRERLIEKAFAPPSILSDVLRHVRTDIKYHRGALEAFANGDGTVRAIGQESRFSPDLSDLELSKILWQDIAPDARVYIDVREIPGHFEFKKSKYSGLWAVDSGMLRDGLTAIYPEQPLKVQNVCGRGILTGIWKSNSGALFAVYAAHEDLTLKENGTQYGGSIVKDSFNQLMQGIGAGHYTVPGDSGPISKKLRSQRDVDDAVYHSNFNELGKWFPPTLGMIHAFRRLAHGPFNGEQASSGCVSERQHLTADKEYLFAPQYEGSEATNMLSVGVSETSISVVSTGSTDYGRLRFVRLEPL